MTSSDKIEYIKTTYWLIIKIKQPYQNMIQIEF